MNDEKFYEIVELLNCAYCENLYDCDNNYSINNVIECYNKYLIKNKLNEILNIFSYQYNLRYDENDIENISAEIIDDMNNKYDIEIFYNSIIKFMKKENYNILNHYDEFDINDLKYLLKIFNVDEIEIIDPENFQEL